MLDEETKKRFEQMTRSEQELCFHKLCESLGTVRPKSIADGRVPETLSIRDFEEYEFLKKLLGFD